MLESRRRGGEDLERDLQPAVALRPGADDGLRAQRNAERSRCTERLGTANFVGSQVASLVVTAELGER